MHEKIARWMANGLYTGNNPITEAELEHLKGAHRDEWERVFEHGDVTGYGFGTIVHFANRDNPDRNQAVIETLSPDGLIETTVTVRASEDDLALQFATGRNNQLAYVDEWGSWMAFDGKRWVKAAQPRVWNLIRPVAREAAFRDAADDAQRRGMLKRTTIANVEALSRGQLIVPSDVFDRHPSALNTQAGIVDLNTGELHPAAPEGYCTKITAVAPAGECPRWLTFLDEITGGDMALQGYLKRLCGYALVGEVVEHILAFLYGTGGNGKGVFLNTITGILGDYVLIPTEVARYSGMISPGIPI
jgi:hypothetical protein